MRELARSYMHSGTHVYEGRAEDRSLIDKSLADSARRLFTRFVDSELNVFWSAGGASGAMEEIQGQFAPSELASR